MDNNEVPMENDLNAEDKANVVCSMEYAKKILKHLNENKGAYSIAGLLISLVLTNLWYFFCYCGYFGMSVALSVDIHYIEKDYTNIFILAIFLICVTIPSYKEL